MADIFDVIVIGAGQSGLACGYYLNRADLNFKILDNQEKCGGAWLHTWDSLNLFSPAEHSSLPGWLMPTSREKFPSKEEVVGYLCNYEARYKLPVERPVHVKKIIREGDLYKIIASHKTFLSKTIISATGTWANPVIPEIKGRENFKGEQFHSATYRNPQHLKGKKVLIVGEGNSGAQILSEVSKVAFTKWATIKKPEFLPDDVDGRVLFHIASAKYKAEKEGKPFDPSNYNLANIVMVPSVKEARERGVLKSSGRFVEIYEKGVIWENGEKEEWDVIIWCTGFRSGIGHLKELVEIGENGKTKTKGTKAVDNPGLWLVGYGGWTGYASATLIGVGRTARHTVQEIKSFVDQL